MIDEQHLLSVQLSTYAMPASAFESSRWGFENKKNKNKKQKDGVIKIYQKGIFVNYNMVQMSGS